MQDSVDLRWWLLTHLDAFTHVSLIYKGALAVSFAAFIGCALLAWRAPKPGDGRWMSLLASDWGFALFLTAFLLAGRWPGLLAPEFNVDESLFLAAAQKLKCDFVFWRSVDVGSSGPFNVYPLLLPALFGLKTEYASARCLALLLVVFSCLCLYFSLRRFYEAGVARITLVPIVTTFAFMTAPDYVHYSSEHMPIALLSLALYLVCRLASSREPIKCQSVLLIGMILGAAPYTKIQSAPIAAAITCICLHLIWSRRSTFAQAAQGMLALGCGLATVSVVLVAFVIAYSQQQTFLKSFILQNLWYSRISSDLFAKVRNFASLITTLRDSRALLGLTAAILLVGVPVLIGFWRKEMTADAQGKRSLSENGSFLLLLYSLAFLAVSVWAVAQPQRPFYHYVLFLIIPCGFAIGVVLGELRKITLMDPAKSGISPSAWWLISRGFIVLCALQLGTALISKNPFLERRHRYLKGYLSPVAQAILEHASPGDSMAVWGWSSKLHLETGVVQATSESAPVYAFHPNPQQAYFVKRFTEELRHSKAKLFVDAQVPGNLSYEWEGVRSQRFVEFPELAEMVDRDFTVVGNVDGVTIYARK